ncbi:hypothetical protein STAFG_2886 [Streptomyces afghaniensis 772]|uniref:Uncharacterized protein n=1 Tax=Streptomyces afghaniensis 772 TaxID=1283301 RepID=S4N0S2_9ACTN|nr:hypothetical protein STAFG_2886 [Streptomyces afghaniensis 772]
MLGRLARRTHRLSRRRHVACASAEGRRWPSRDRKISCRLHDGAVLGNRDNPFQHADTGGSRRGYRTGGGSYGGPVRNDRVRSMPVGPESGTGVFAHTAECVHGPHCPQRLRLMPGDCVFETSE